MIAIADIFRMLRYFRAGNLLTKVNLGSKIVPAKCSWQLLVDSARQNFGNPF